MLDPDPLTPPEPYLGWRSMDAEPPSRLLLWVLVAFLVFVLGVVAVAVWASR